MKIIILTTALLAALSPAYADTETESPGGIEPNINVGWYCHAVADKSEKIVLNLTADTEQNFGLVYVSGVVRPAMYKVNGISRVWQFIDDETITPDANTIHVLELKPDGNAYFYNLLEYTLARFDSKSVESSAVFTCNEIPTDELPKPDDK